MFPVKPLFVGDFPASHVWLPEGIPMNIPLLSHDCPIMIIIKPYEPTPLSEALWNGSWATYKMEKQQTQSDPCHIKKLVWDIKEHTPKSG